MYMKKSLIFILLFCLLFCGCKQNTNNGKVNEIAVNNIVINKSHAYVDKGDKIILLAQVFPFNSDNQNIIWKSDNTNIASVDDGIVIGKNEGRTVITATSEDGNFSASCIVFVSTPKLNYDNYQNNLNTKKLARYINKDDLNDYGFRFSKNDNLSSKMNFIINQINSFNESIKSIDSLFDSIKLNYQLKNNDFYQSNNESEILSNTEDNSYKNYIYNFEYIYNSDGIQNEEDENTIYKDDKTIIKEKITIL